MKKGLLFLIVFTAICFQSMATIRTSNVTGSAGTPASWSAAGTWSGGNVPVATDSVIISAGAFVTTGAITRNAGTTTVVNGSLTATGLITLSGTMSVSNGGAYIHNHSGLVIPTASWATGSTLEVRSTATSGNLTGLGQSFHNVIINCSALTGVLSCVGALTTINGDLTISATNTGSFRLGQTETYTTTIGGTLSVNAGTMNTATSGVATLTIGGDLNIAGGTLIPGTSSSGKTSFAINGTKPGSTGSFNMSAGAYTPASTAATILAIAGDMNLTGGTYTLATSGSASNLDSIKVNGTVAGTTGKLAMSGNAVITQPTTSTWSINLAGDFTMSGTSSFVGNTGTSSGRLYTFNIGGSMSIGTGTSFSMVNTSSVALNSINFTGGSSSNVSFTNSGTFTITGVGRTSVASNKTLTLNSNYNLPSASTAFVANGTLNLATNNITGSGAFTLGAAATLKIGNANGITSTAATGNIQSTGTRTFPTTANYEYVGTVTQVTGNQLPATVNKLTIINTGGTSGVTLTAAVTVSDSLVLTSGNLTLGANNITLTQSKPVAGTPSTTNHIVTNSTGGVVATYGAAAFTFPIGYNNTIYSPLVVTNGGTSQTYTIGATNATVYAPSTDGLPWSWSVAASGTSSTSLDFNWTNGDAGAGLSGTPTNGTAQRYNGTSWTGQGGTTTAGTPNITSISGITSFTNTLWTVAYPNTPTFTVSTSSLSFPSTVAGTNSAGQSFTVSGALLSPASGNITVTAPNIQFEVSTDSVAWSSSVLLPYTGSTLSSTTVFVRFSPQSAGSFSGNVTIAGGSVASPSTVAVSGTGNNNINYYNVASADITIPSNWGTNTNGTGSSPTDFISDGQIFNLTNSGATMSDTLTVSGTNSKIIIGNGSTNISFAATSNITGTVDVTNNATLQLMVAAYTTTLGTLATGSTVNYAAASGVQSVAATSYSNLTLSGGGSRTFGTTTNISGTFTPGTGFSATSGTIFLNSSSSSQVIPAFNYSSLTISGTNGKSTSGILNVVGTLTMTNSFTVATSSTLNLDSTSSLSGAGAMTVSGTLQKMYTTTGLSFSAGSGSITVAAGGTLKVTGYTGNNGTLTFTNVNFTSGIGAAGSTLYIAAAGVPRIPASPTTFNGNVVWDVPTQPANAVIINATPFTISGNLTVVSTGAGQISNGSGSSGRALTIGGNLIMQSGRYDIAGSAAGSTGSNSTTVNGDVILNAATDTLFVASSPNSGSNNTLSIKGNLVHTAGVIGKLSGATSNGTITFNGATSQDITSLGIVNGANVSINNSNGVRLLSNLSLGGNLTFTSGKLRTNSYGLTLTGTTASFSGANATNYIALCDANNTPSATSSVTVQSIGTGGRGSFTFPIGADASSYNPLTLSNSVTAVDFTVKVSKVAVGGADTANSVRRTWNIQASGAASAVLSMQWAAAEEGVSFTRNSAAVVHYNGTIIDTASSGGIAAGSDPYTFGSGATEFTSFGDFGISNGVIQPAALPTAQVSNLSITPLSTTATISWTKGAGTGTNTLVVVKSGSAVNTDPTDLASYTDGSNVFGSGSQIGTGNYVVYNSTGTSFSLTGLIPSTTYHVALYSFNGNAGTENYLKPALTGNATTTQTVYTWIGGANTLVLANQANWSTAGVGGAAVGSSGTISFTIFDKLVWDGTNLGGGYTGATIDTLGANLSVGQIEVKNGANVTFATTTTRAVTINGVGGTDVLIDATSALTLGYAAGSSGTSVNTVNVTLSSGATASISGALNIGNAISGGSPGNHSFIANTAGAVTFNSGATCVYNLSSSIFPFGTAVSGSVIFTSGSTLRGFKANDLFGGNTVVTFQTGSTFEYAGSSNSFVPFGNTGSPTITAPQTFSNFVFNGSVALTPAFTVGVTMDSLIVAPTSVGTVTLKATNGLNVKGNITNRSTTNPLVFDLGATGTANVNMVGTAAQSILNAGGGITFGSTTASRIMVLNINNAAGVNIGNATHTGNVTNLVSHTLNLTSGALNIGTTTYTLAGIVNRDGVTYNGSISTSGNDTVTVTGLASLPAGLFTSNTLRNLIINRSAGVTLGSSLTIAGSLILTSGVLTTSTNSVSVAGTINRTSGWVNGNLARNVATGSNVLRTFDLGDATNYTPLMLTFASVTTAGDVQATALTGVSSHSNYGTYPLSKTAYLNRYWSLTNVNTLAFTNYNALAVYVSADLIGGATASTIKTGVYNAGWLTYATNAGTNRDTALAITAIGDILLANCVTSVTPSVSISSTSTAVCTGSSVTFTATPTNGGTTPSYQWKKNSTNVGTNSTTLILQDNQVTSGDVITCVMTANNACQTINSVTSNSITLSVGTVTPSVTISTLKDTVCSGNNTIFTASATNGGSSPVYVWYKNGVSQGSGSTITFLSGTLATNDAISCVLTANNACQTTATANSNVITLTVLPSPVVGTSTGGTTVCAIGSTRTVYNSNTHLGGVWSTSDANVATVNTVNGASGLVTIVGAGTAILTYTKTGVGNSSGCVSSSSTTMIVAPAPAPNAITGTNNMCRGFTTVLSNTTVGGVWSSQNAYATISTTTGLSTTATGVNAGTAVIKYTVTNGSGCTASSSYNVTVNPTPNVPYISYAPGTPNPQYGATANTYCTNKTFTVVGAPATGGGAVGVWSSTGVITVNASTGFLSTGATPGAGSLTYTYTSAAGCVNSRTITGSVVTCASRGVNGQQSTARSLQSSVDFTMYPNPARSTVNLQMETLVGAGSIVVTDLYGKTVKTQALSLGTNTLNIATLSKGFYLISTITEQGKTTKKLVVE